MKSVSKFPTIEDICVTSGSAPTSRGNNQGRAFVVTQKVEITDGDRKPQSGQITLTLLKDDERLKSDGWLDWDIDFKAGDQVNEEVKWFLKKYDGK